MVNPVEDRCCSWCGTVFDEDLAEEIGVQHVEIQSGWRPIPPPPEGHGVNHVSIITRRHLIDDVEFKGQEEHKRRRIAFKPFQMQANYVPQSKDCAWCNER